MPLARDAKGNVNLKGENFERDVAGIGKLDPEMYRSISLDRWRNCKQSRLNEPNEHYLMALFGRGAHTLTWSQDKITQNTDNLI